MYNTRTQKRKNVAQFSPRKRTTPVEMGNNNPSSNKVINLSDVSLTSPQMEVLNLGLNFSPTAKFDPFSAVKDLHLFARKLLLKKLHHRNPNDVTETIFETEEETEAFNALNELLQEQSSTSSSKFPKSLIPRSKKFPPLTLSANIDLFVKLVSEDLKKVSTMVNGHNCTLEQKKAIEELSSRTDIVIKPSDKGGNTVVWPCNMYEREVYKLLKDVKCYRRLTFNPLSSFCAQLRDILLKAVEASIISKKQMEYLSVEYPTIATFYVLPKVHKNASCPPGRPIVAGNNSFTEPICKLIDFVLHPMVETLPSYLKDTNDVLRKMDGLQLEENMILVTCDIESLYTSIIHKDGVAAVEQFLRMSSEDAPGNSNGGGLCALICKFVPGLWERKIFITEPLPLVDRVQYWGRYIDDILFIWQGSFEELQIFMGHLNDNNLNLRLTYKAGRSNMEFLDILLEVDELGFIHTDVFRKPTSTNSLLHFSSSHQQSLIKGIPVGQFLRMRRICSDESSFERQSRDLSTRFAERGYSSRCIKQAYWRARCTDRSQALNKQRLEMGTMTRWYEVRDILYKHWKVLQLDPILAQYIPSKPAVTYRRSPNIRDSLVHSHYVNKKNDNPFGSRGPKWGCRPCGSCVACPNVERCTVFSSADGNKTYNILHPITCTTTAVIYCASCPCELKYVGLTSRELRRRVREHVLDIKAAQTAIDIQSLKTVPKHFKLFHQCDSSLLRVRGIDHIVLNTRGGDIKKRLAQIEAKWIYRLNTLAPHGLNEQMSFSAYL
ncbi:unnamed protein product [Ranitomeya imitator]|uniref:Helix-turn-helix domain-containing protein n=1 Tax=Ranitomeya imitator TaxID=111125 RepID=A0ABN9M785_9NEOB|nr:unnamed protein product [Ranitomeya imitator]